MYRDIPLVVYRVQRENPGDNIVALSFFLFLLFFFNILTSLSLAFLAFFSVDRVSLLFVRQCMYAKAAKSLCERKNEKLRHRVILFIILGKDTFDKYIDFMYYIILFSWLCYFSTWRFILLLLFFFFFSSLIAARNWWWWFLAHANAKAVRKLLKSFRTYREKERVVKMRLLIFWVEQIASFQKIRRQPILLKFQDFSRPSN